MTLKRQLHQALAGCPHFSVGNHQLAVAENDQQLRCDLVALDHLACSFEELSLTSDKLRAATLDQLKPIAQQLAARLTYLLEPISPIETDSAGCVVQMRSSPPQKGEEGTSYYELLVGRNGSLSLRRYLAPRGQLRMPTSAHVTREVLLRLADDFEAVA